MSKCDNCIHVGVCHCIMYGGSDEIEECRHFEEARPHGKWIDNGSVGCYGEHEWYCSNCKFQWIACKRESLDLNWCFCPTCGADMRGEVEDNV